MIISENAIEIAVNTRIAASGGTITSLKAGNIRTVKTFIEESVRNLDFGLATMNIDSVTLKGTGADATINTLDISNADYKIHFFVSYEPISGTDKWIAALASSGMTIIGGMDTRFVHDPSTS